MTFPLKIVTPEGVRFNGPADRLIVRTTAGDMAVLARHTDCVCALGTGRAMVEAGGARRTAECSGGLLRVSSGEAVVIAHEFRWSTGTA